MKTEELLPLKVYPFKLSQTFLCNRNILITKFYSDLFQAGTNGYY